MVATEGPTDLPAPGHGDFLVGPWHDAVLALELEAVEHEQSNPAHVRGPGRARSRIGTVPSSRMSVNARASPQPAQWVGWPSVADFSKRWAKGLLMSV